ncbi:MAG: transcription elongation factor GreA [Firmicutes bacterium]|nr:transcription elongation factor GreA [Bacillota bacterium]
MQVKLTQEGKNQLEERLEHLTTVGRTEIAKEIQKAREFGDISENAEYDAAKNAQAQMEAEIIDIENKLRHAVIIEEKKGGAEVGMGNKVKLLDVASGKEYEYTIVGTTEANPIDEKRISDESPVGRAVIGKRKGETAIVVTPKGKREYKVVKID